MHREQRKYGSVIYDAKANVAELFGKIKVGDSVSWLGRKVGSCSNDGRFVPGQHYQVWMIYPSNLDLEIEQYIDGEHVTIRAGKDEYGLID